MKSIRLTEFLEVFFPNEDETIYLRALKAKNAPDKAENKPKQLSLTRRQLQNDIELQTKVKGLNKHRGIFFVVNAGGNQDDQIKRFNAFFVENDKLTIEEQNTLLDACPIPPSIRIETLKSVHAYWLITGNCKESDWRDIQHRLINYFDGDKSIHNPSRLMRLPFFSHVSVEDEKLLYKRVDLTEFEPIRRYTVKEMQQAFPHFDLTEAKGNTIPGSYKMNEPISEGERNSTLASLAGTMRNRGMTENAIFEALKTENAARCQPPLDDDEVYKISRSISRYPPARSNSNVKGSQQTWQSPLSPLKTVNLAEVKVKKVSWLWNPFIAFGTFTLIDGEEGIGKSLLTLGLGCTVADGKNIDSTSGFDIVNAEPGNVLLLSAEESISYVVKPRILAMGGNCERFIAIEEPFSFDKDGLLRLEMAIAVHEPKLVLIDPLFSYAGKIRLNDDNDIRSVTNEIIRIAAKFDCAIIGIRHIGKSKGNGDARAAGLNGVGWRASARSALLVGKDPNTGELAICQHKNNLSQKSSKSYGFKIETAFVEIDSGEVIEVGKFFWTGESSLTEKQMLSQAVNPDSQLEESDAVAFLNETLSDGEREAKEIEEEATKLGITKKQLRIARVKLGIKSGNGTIRREGFGKGSKSFWRLQSTVTDAF